MSIFNQYEKEEIEKIGKENILIIEGVEERKFLYDKNCPALVKGARMDAFTEISREILKHLDVELTAEEVEKRWTSMRKGYVRSVNGNQNYYLHKYLNFLRPHIKKQPCAKKRSPYVPLSLDPQSNKQQQNLKSKVETTTRKSLREEETLQILNDEDLQILNDEEDLQILNDEEDLQILNDEEDLQALSDEGDKQNIASNMKNNVEIKKNLKSKVETITTNSLPKEGTVQIDNDTGNKQNISSKEDNNDNDDEYWDTILQDNYFDQLNSMLLKVPQYNKISCMIEVFQAIEYYTHFHNK